ncbi:transposase [Mycobacterium tuberculosis]
MPQCDRDALTDNPGGGRALDTARTDLLASSPPSPSIWRQIWSNNPQERLNREPAIEPTSWASSPTALGIIRLVGAVLAEQHDEWIEGRRYLASEVLTRVPSSTDQHRRTRQAANHQHPSTDHLDCHPKDHARNLHCTLAPRPWPGGEQSGFDPGTVADIADPR